MKTVLARLIAVLLLALIPPSKATAAEVNAPPIADLIVAPMAWPIDLGTVAKLGPLVYRGGVTLSTADGKFRGFSGLWISADGKRLVGVEEGGWLTARLAYDGGGNLAGLVPTDAGLLLDEQGKTFAAADDRKAEALDFDGSRFMVGFEINDRVLTYNSFKDRGTRVPLPAEALENIVRGAGFSSVTALKGGGMAFLAEYTRATPTTKSYSPNNPTRGWLRLKDGTSGPFWLRPSVAWFPVSLDQLPDGDLLLVELYIPRGTGAGEATTSRISRIKLADLRIGATVDAEELAILAPPMPSPRIEGMSIRKGREGEILVYVMANIAPSHLYMFALKPR